MRVYLGRMVASGGFPSRAQSSPLSSHFLVSHFTALRCDCFGPTLLVLLVRLHRCSYQEAFHLATMGGAEVLGLQKVIGNFLPGKQVRLFAD